MPALAFGLGTAKGQKFAANSAQKRKAVFKDQDDSEGEDDAFNNISQPLKNNGKHITTSETKPPLKSPKISLASTASSQIDSSKYSNLSALRNAKLQDAVASQLDPSVYDYDAVYETFQTKPTKTATDKESDGPKYMTSLLKSSEVRKRDQLRAKEKQLQRERENEGDEFADKEKFVTGAYKKQQEELRKLEEEEKRRDEEEELRRRKGGGMSAFNKALLLKEEQRAKQMEQAAQHMKEAREKGLEEERGLDVEQETEDKQAQKLNAAGANIVVNDDGEVVDKRQLLGAGLNVAPKTRIEAKDTATRKGDDKARDWRPSSRMVDKRGEQRERQTRMIERQIEEMEEKQKQADEAEQKELQNKNKSRVTDEAKMSAKERYLQRKREREEAAQQASGKS